KVSTVCRERPIVVLAAFVVALSATLLGAGCSDEARERQCREGRVACDEGCVDLLADPLHCGGCGLACAETEICSDGRCVPSCPSGMGLCDDTCVALDRDWRNCGACGTTCE